MTQDGIVDAFDGVLKNRLFHSVLFSHTFITLCFLPYDIMAPFEMIFDFLTAMTSFQAGVGTPVIFSNGIFGKF